MLRSWQKKIILGTFFTTRYAQSKCMILILRGAFVQIASEIKKLTLAQPGTRHNTLIQVSKALGQWIGGGHLDEDKARDLLHQAAGRNMERTSPSGILPMG